MPQVRLSKAEKRFIEEGISEDVRADGRRRLEFRHFTLDVGVVPQASGSAHLCLGLSEVLVAIRCEVTEPRPGAPDRGFMEVNVSCSPSAAWDLEGGDRERSDLVLTQALSRILIGPNTMDWKALAITPGRQCWMLYVDATVIEAGGNLMDAISIAALAALQDTRIPKISVLASSSRQLAQLEVADDVRKFTFLDTSGVPIAVTLLRIGPFYVVDPSLEEEICLASRLVVAVNAKGMICCVQKSGKQGLHPSDLLTMLTNTRDIALQLLQHVRTTVQQKIADTAPAPDSYGFVPV